MKHYYINRSMGDIIYALPAIKAATIGEAIIYTGLPPRACDTLRPLIMANGVQLRHESGGIPRDVINLER